MVAKEYANANVYRDSILEVRPVRIYFPAAVGVRNCQTFSAKLRISSFLACV